MASSVQQFIYEIARAKFTTPSINFMSIKYMLFTIS